MDYSWMDKDFMSNPSEKDTYVSPLADDTAIPCDACPMKKDCEVSGKECVALRGWYNEGKDCTWEFKKIKVKDEVTGKIETVVTDIVINNVGRLLR